MTPADARRGCFRIIGELRETPTLEFTGTAGGMREAFAREFPDCDYTGFEVWQPMPTEDDPGAGEWVEGTVCEACDAVTDNTFDSGWRGDEDGACYLCAACVAKVGP